MKALAERLVPFLMTMSQKENRMKLFRQYGIWFAVSGKGVRLFWNSSDAIAYILQEARA